MGLLGSGKSVPVQRKTFVGNPNRQLESRQKRAITAAGERVDRKHADELRRLIQPWQSRALTYYDIVPEIKYAAQFYSRALSKIRIFAAELDENGEPQETQNEDVRAQVERIRDPGGGGRSSMQSSYGRLKFLTGEVYCFVTVDEDTEAEQWEMLSSDELRITTGGEYTRFKAPSLAAESFRDPPDDAYELADNEAIVYRMWTRHPRYSSLADSTMQAVLDVCEELVLLTAAVRARAKSRLAGSGILLVNGNVFPISQEDADTDDENAEEDSFLTQLTDAMIAPMQDEGSPSSVVPLVVRVDVEKIADAMAHIQIVDPTQLYPETGLRNECVKRLAIGLDMPPEALLGMADSNHWTSWQIDEQTWKAHLQPVAQAMVDDLTSAFLQPTLRQAGIADWQKYVIGYDATDVINHPDRSKDAKDLHDRDAISDDALRKAAGFDDDDAITDEAEWWRRIGIKLRDASYVKYGEPGVQRGGVMTGPEELLSPQGPTAAPGTSSAEAVKGPPEQPTEAKEPVTAALNGFTNVAKILGASDLAMHRARELAGSRIRSKARRDVDARLAINGVANRNAAAVLGREKVRALTKLTDQQLVEGSAESLKDTFRMWGLDEDLAAPLAAMIEQHAARTLYEARPIPLPETYMQYVLGLHATERV